MALLHNLSCWESNTPILLDNCILECISEILALRKNKQKVDVLEASYYFDPLAIATLVNLCRKGVCTMYSYNRWKKVLGLAIDSFKSLIKNNQLQLNPPTNICYELCSINDWDHARSLVALFVNCLTVDLHWSQLFRKNWVDNDPEIINHFLQYANIADSEGFFLLSLLFCLIVDGDYRLTENRDLVLDQIRQSTQKMQNGTFPAKFCAFIWADITPVHSLLSSKEPEVREWSRAFLEASSKLNLKCYRAPKRQLPNQESCNPVAKRKRMKAPSWTATSPS